MRFRDVVRRSKVAVVLAIAALTTAACVTGPMDTLSPEGPIAEQQDRLFMPVFWIAVGVFVLVEGLLVIALIKFRHRPGKEVHPKQTHGNTKVEIAWTLAPALLLLGIAFPTVAMIFDQAGPPEPDALHVQVIGHQWWWEYRYDTDPEVVSANELVIPTGRQVFLSMESADVIHSFWVPKLAGKQDLVPGRVNDLRLFADEPGEYLGQCAEFCAISHANMRLKAIALEPADFDTWLRGQQQAAREPIASEEVSGRDLFMANACINCHAIAGTDAAGRLGPDLTHFASRTTFGAAIFEMDEESLIDWILHARDQKAGVIMPNFDRPQPADDPYPQSNFKQLSRDEARLIARYLLSLV